MSGNPKNINRRKFVILGCAAAVAGCSSHAAENAPIFLRPASIDAGPVTDFATDGVYDRFARQGFFLIRRGNDLFALSSICTHRTCKL